MAGHWWIPTDTEAREGGAYWVAACTALSGPHTETMKQVSCRACKAEMAHPSTPVIAAARLRGVVIDEQEKSDYFMSIACNGCGREADATEFRDEHAHHTIKGLVLFLDHVAYEHMGGSAVLLVRTQEFFSSYQNNLAVGKPSMTEHEDRWRERVADLTGRSREKVGLS